MTRAHGPPLFLTLLFPLLSACSAGLLAGGETNEDLARQGQAAAPVLLGMTPAPPANVTVPDWPGKPLYMVRLWDMDVTWSDIERNAPVNGVHSYDWTRLDALMNKIVAADMRPLYVFFGTPEWAAPGCTQIYKSDDGHKSGGCPDYPQDPENWSAFTSAVATRYADLPNPPAYEVWNEPNLGPTAPIAYWKGTHDQLIDLNRRAQLSVKAAVSAATVLCCGWNRRAANNSSSAVDEWLKRGGAGLVDAVSYHPYPSDWNPQTAAETTDRFRAAMDRHGVSKPLWATEVGYVNGLNPATARALTHDEQAQLVADAIGVLRAKQIPVILWYPLDEDHEGSANSKLVGLRRVLPEALAAAIGNGSASEQTPEDPVGALCDPTSQPSPQWGVKDGQCLPACGVAGGTLAFETPCAHHDKLDAGAAYDVAYCCKEPPPACDPTSQPSPQWGVKDGTCLPACGVAGGTVAFETPCADNGKLDAGAAYDVAYCCKEPPPASPPASPPPANPPPVCDPTSQPSPQWGVKDGKCLPSCGAAGGTVAFETPCADNGKLDAGMAYDVAYCCKEPPPVCDPTSQPSPQWGVKDGKCLPACGVAGGTAAFESPCAVHGMVDAGAAYDVVFCCK